MNPSWLNHQMSHLVGLLPGRRKVFPSHEWFKDEVRFKQSVVGSMDNNDIDSSQLDPPPLRGHFARQNPSEKPRRRSASACKGRCFCPSLVPSFIRISSPHRNVLVLSGAAGPHTPPNCSSTISVLLHHHRRAHARGRLMHSSVSCKSAALRRRARRAPAPSLPLLPPPVAAADAASAASGRPPPHSATPSAAPCQRTASPTASRPRRRPARPTALRSASPAPPLCACGTRRRRPTASWPA